MREADGFHGLETGDVDVEGDVETGEVDVVGGLETSDVDPQGGLDTIEVGVVGGREARPSAGGTVTQWDGQLASRPGLGRRTHPLARPDLWS